MKMKVLHAKRVRRSCLDFAAAFYNVVMKLQLKHAAAAEDQGSSISLCARIFKVVWPILGAN